MNRLKEKYLEKVKPALARKLGITNYNQLPRLEKIVVSSGVGRAVQDSKNLDLPVKTITKITGQKPVVTKAKKSVATFKLREGNSIGVMVTLRDQQMYYFLDQLFNIVLPRQRDFRGLDEKSFDPDGNYNIGIREQTVFAQISYEEASSLHGLQITIVTSGKDKKASEALLVLLGMPLKRRG